MRPTTLGRLHDLARFLAGEEHLHEKLTPLANYAARAAQAAACSVMLLQSEGAESRLKLWATSDDLPPEAYSETPSGGQSIASQVLMAGSPLLIEDVDRSEFRYLARRRADLGPSFMCVPISIGNQLVGVANFSNRPDTSPFIAADLMVAEIVAAMIGKAVQVERQEVLLRSRVAQMALAKGEKKVASQTVGHMAPARVSKLLAKSFYKDLRAAGFEAGQIIDAATEIIEHVTSDLARLKKRMHRA